MADDTTVTEEPREDTHASDLLEGQDLDAIESGVTEDLIGGTPDTGEDGDVAPAPDDPAVPDEAESSHPATPASLVDRLGEIGFSDIADDEDGINRLIEAFQSSQHQAEERGRQLDAAQPLVNYGNQYLAQQAQQNQVPAATTPEAVTNPWNPPKYDAAATERYREINPETGTGQWKTDTPAEIRANADAYQAHIEDWSHRLTTEPDKALAPIVNHMIEQRLQEFRSSFDTERTQEQEDSFWGVVRERNPWLFHLDPVTNQPMNDPRTGDPMLSPAGISISQHMDRLEGLGDPRQVWEYAVLAHKAQINEGVQPSNGTPAPTTTPATTAAATKQRKQSEHLRRAAGHVPDRSGSLPTPEQPSETSQNPQLRPGQKLMQQAALDGVGNFWDQG
jgi:hypothetical protein